MKFGNKTINTIFHNAEELLNIMTIGQQSPIFPFEVVSGFVTETRTSARRDYTATDSSEETYRVFTGEETPLVRWEGSTRAYLANPDDKELKSEYKVGNVLYGSILSQDFAQTFEQDSLGKDLKDWITGEAFIIKSTTWKVEQNDLMKLYIITEKGNNKLLKIDTVTNHYNEETGDWVFAEISLIALNLELEQTGQAVQQKIQFSAPGEGFAFPIANKELQKDGTYKFNITLDSMKLINTPITSAQVSLWGTAPISSITVMGRPMYDIVKKDNEEIYEGKIEQPQHLLINKFLSPIDDALQTTGSIVNNYVMLLDAQLQLKTYWDEWKAQQESKYDDNIKKTYEGILTVTDAQTILSNPTSADGGFEHNLWVDYDVTTNSLKLNTSLSGYFGTNEITLPNSMKVADIMNIASFVNAQVEKLPMDITESIPFRVVGLPIIGGFLNKFVSGFGLGWNSQDKWYNANTFTALFPAGQYDYITKAVYGIKDGKGLIPVDIFNSDDETEVSAITGTNSVRTAVRFELTNRYSVDDAGTVLNTKNIGQKINGVKQVLNEKLSAVQKSITGFIPDMIIVDTPAKMNYTVTYFSGDQEVFRAVYQTKGKYFNNTREWKSINFHSHWFEETGQVVKGIETVYPKDPIGTLPNELSHRIISPFGTGTLGIDHTTSRKTLTKTFLVNFSQFGITKDDLIKNYDVIYKENVKIATEQFSLQNTGNKYKDEKNTNNIVEKMYEYIPGLGAGQLLKVKGLFNGQTTINSANIEYTDTDIKIKIEIEVDGKPDTGFGDGLSAKGTVYYNLAEVDLIYKGDSSDEPFYGTGETTIYHPNGDVTLVGKNK